MPPSDALVAQWKTLYAQTLPKLAKARDSAQPRWPVSLDHCFARIILDNTVGKGEQQWDKVIRKPAVKNMVDEQLVDAIALGESIRHGDVNLEELDQISLLCRGKNEGKYGGKTSFAKTGQKRKAEEVDTKHSPPKKRQSTLKFDAKDKPDSHVPTDQEKLASKTSDGTGDDQVDYSCTLASIRKSALTPYRKRLYTVLLSVPRGRYTTYAAMSKYLESSARAVGNGIRNNPWAPDVPCHRVLAADGSIGGFYGDWGKDGKHAKKKVDLLREEGVRFDVKGKVVGEPFRKFHEFENSRSGK